MLVWVLCTRLNSISASSSFRSQSTIFFSRSTTLCLALMYSRTYGFRV